LDGGNGCKASFLHLISIFIKMHGRYSHLHLHILWRDFWVKVMSTSVGQSCYLLYGY
jgi:hypothetical protein